MTSATLSPLLRFGLLLDAAGSGATGIALTVAPGFWADLFGLPSGLLLPAGLAMLPWAVGLALIVRRGHAARPTLRAVIGLNIAYVVLCLAAVFGGLLAPNSLGLAFVLAQAAAVALFAELQFLGLRRTETATLA